MAGANTVTPIGQAQIIRARKCLAWMPLDALQEAIQSARTLLPMEAVAVAQTVELMRADGSVKDPETAVKALMVLARHEAEHVPRNRV